LLLSVLDQSVAVTGRPHGTSIHETIELAQYCETLGYYRFWVSEHHNHDTITGSAPEIVMAAIGATTDRIRIGSAGVMLPHYSALKVAEQFRVLDAIAPDRIDLGLGRAPGSDSRTAYDLNPNAAEGDERFAISWHGCRALRCPMVILSVLFGRFRQAIRSRLCGCWAPPITALSAQRISACPIVSPISSLKGRAAPRHWSFTDTTISQAHGTLNPSRRSVFGL
jgi:hypothetical protein